MTIIDLCDTFSTDERCRELLERLRWPLGAECPRCKNPNPARLETNSKILYCKDCDYQFTVLSNTIFHDTHLPLLKWFTATYLICESRKGMSANQLKRTLGISYKTAWYLCHRIRFAMSYADRPMLSGTCEMDETYIGGRTYGKGWFNGRLNKEVVVGIRERNGELRFFHAPDAKAKTLAKYIKEHVSEDVEVIVTDEAPVYPFVMKTTGVGEERHKTIQHKAKVYVKGDVHTNTVESAFSLLKRGIVGAWHKISVKHLPAYLDEMEFRFNRRNRHDLFLDTLRHMITADPLTFAKLTA